MKAITADWLSSAKKDIETIDAILDNLNLTAVVAFHAQQCVENVSNLFLKNLTLMSKKLTIC